MTLVITPVPVPEANALQELFEDVRREALAVLAERDELCRRIARGLSMIEDLIDKHDAGTEDDVLPIELRALRGILRSGPPRIYRGPP
jgi:hypothetical protein